MNSGGDAGVLHWRQFIVDALIGAAALAVAFAAASATTGVVYMLLIPGVLVGIGLMLEPSVTPEPTDDTGPQPLRVPTESKPARPRPQVTDRFDAVIIDATSV
jgi:hypothetical protein